MNINRREKMSTPNKGVRCVVDSCHYYMSGDRCGAEYIEIRPKDAETCEETDCATFCLDEQEENNPDIPPQFY
ncbi:MAG: DUF1540 domain-containing protein [Clostridia bacterium]|nr:DUF1540 domain-containing protein [Clostridia bacterium]MDR3644721.1 DUF1540 domain-containing protein [Clostridia bacterium]